MFRLRISVSRGDNRRSFEWPRNSSIDDHPGTPAPQSITLPYHPGTTDAQLVTLPQAQCRLLNIPPEIRLYIYELVLHLNDGTVHVKDVPKQHLAVLQTCRRILQEAEAIFYAIHRFQYSPHSPHFSRIGVDRRNTITALNIVTSSGAYAFSAMRRLHLFPNLRSLYIQREMSVRYLNISEWSILTRQMKDELAKLQTLRELKIFTPTASSELTSVEKTRQEKLRRVDAMLERGAGGERSSIGVIPNNDCAIEQSCSAGDIEWEWDIITGEDA